MNRKVILFVVLLLSLSVAAVQGRRHDAKPEASNVSNLRRRHRRKNRRLTENCGKGDSGKGESGKGESGKGESGKGESGKGESGKGESGKGDSRRRRKLCEDDDDDDSDSDEGLAAVEAPDNDAVEDNGIAPVVGPDNDAVEDNGIVPVVVPDNNVVGSPGSKHIAADSAIIRVSEGSNNNPFFLLAPTSDNATNVLTIVVDTLPVLGTVKTADGFPISAFQQMTPQVLTALLYDAPTDYDGVSDPGDFTYTVSLPGSNETATGSVDIIIVDGNAPPVAFSSEITVIPGSTGNPLAFNEPVDAENDPMLVGIVVVPVLGSVVTPAGEPVASQQIMTIEELMDLVYDAPDTYDGTTDPGIFQYIVSDETGNALGKVDINIFVDNNSPPVVDSQAMSIPEGTQDTPLGLSSPTDPDGDELTVVVAGLPTRGTITKADGTPLTNGETITPEELIALEYDAAPTGIEDPGGFVYFVEDGNGGTASGSVDIIIFKPNSPPVADSEAMTVVEGTQDTPLDLDPPTDPDDDPLTITVTEVPDLGSVTKPDGTPVEVGDTLTPEELTELIYDAPEEYDDNEDPGDFVYTVEDGNGGSTNGVVDIIVTPVNDPPVADSNELTVDEGSVGTPMALEEPVDVDSEDLTIIVTGLPSLGSVKKSDGTPVANSDFLTTEELTSLTYDAPSTYDGSDPGDFLYFVRDESGGTDNGSVDITIVPGNSPPVADSEEMTVVEGTQDTPLDLNPPTDPDDDPLTITVTEVPDLGSVTKPDGTPVEVGDTLTPEELTELIYDAPEKYDDNEDPGDFVYTVEDGNGGSTNGVVDIIVTPVNDPPVAGNAETTVNESSSGNPFGVLLPTPTDEDNDPLTITVTGVPILGTVKKEDGTPVSVGDTLTPEELAELIYDAPDVYSGSEDPGDFTYEVSDGNGGKDDGVVDITIVNVNDPPEATSNVIVVEVGSSETPLGLGPPTDEDNDPLTITVDEVPTLGDLTKGDGTPVNVGDTLTPEELVDLVFTPPDVYNGEDPGDFVYTVTDGNGGKAVDVCDIIIQVPPSKAPTNAPTKAPTKGPTSAPTEESAALTPIGGPDFNSGIDIPRTPTEQTFSCATTVPLVDGEMLSASLSVSGPFDGIDSLLGPSTDLPATVGGRAIIDEMGNTAFAHFTFVLDISDSTDRACGGDSTGTILDCEKEALLNLLGKIRDLGVAVDIGVVVFDGNAMALDLDRSQDGTQTLVDADNTDIDAAILETTSGGSTSYFRAIRKTIEVVEEAVKNPQITNSIVVFITDGIPIQPASAKDLKTLGDMGTRVYTFAVGEESECGLPLTRVSNIGTGGVCTEVDEPSQLERVLESVIFPARKLDSVSVTWNASPLPGVTLAPEIPQGGLDAENPVIVTGTNTVDDGSSNVVCIEATSQVDIARCCIDFTA